MQIPIETVLQRAFQVIGEMTVSNAFDADQFSAMDEQINDLQLEVASLLPEDEHAQEQES